MDNDPHDKNPSECIAHCIAVIFAHVRVDDAWKACQLRREEHVNIIRHFNHLWFYSAHFCYNQPELSSFRDQRTGEVWNKNKR